MIWAVFLVMAAVAALLLLAPLRRPARASSGRSAHDLAVYRDQLGELERDRARGLVGEAEAEAARTEIARRILEADRAVAAETAPRSAKPVERRAVATVALLAPAAAFALYLTVGSPGLVAGDSDKGPAAAAQGEEDELRRLAGELEERMRKTPDDPRGWSLLGRTQARLGRFDAAADSFGRAVALAPHDADLRARLGEAITYRDGGTVTPDAHSAFDAVLAIDPQEPRANYYLGLADLQAGETRKALDRWLALEARSPPDAPWRTALSPRIDTLAGRLGLDAAALRAEAKARAEAAGPSAADVAAASRMSPEERQAMIRSMVEGLAARLEESPDDADGWLRLGRAYRVLGAAEKSRDAYAKAASLMPRDLDVLTLYAASIAATLKPGTAMPQELKDAATAMLAVAPEDSNALWLAGAAALQDGDRTAAEAHWRKLYNLLPADSPQRAPLRKRLDTLAPTPAEAR